MKIVRIKDNVYEELRQVAALHNIGMERFLSEAMQAAAASMKERYVLDLYRTRKRTIARDAV